MKAVGENPLAMMLEYVFFDFAPFGLVGGVGHCGLQGLSTRLF